MKIGAVDLFCGIGGLTYGLQTGGVNVIAGIDSDPSCRYAYVENNQSQFINKSIEDVEGREVNDLLRDCEIKVLVGCAPCQPFSNHQKDKQNRKRYRSWGLLSEYARLIAEVMPHVVSMENVPELQNEAIFHSFVQVLKDLDYDIAYEVVDASDYGVPQRRRRLILLASILGKIRLIKPSHTAGKVMVRDVLRQMPPLAAGQIYRDDHLHCASCLSEINLLRIRASRPGGTWKDWPEELRLQCHKAQKGKTYVSVYGRMDWNDVAPTITTQFFNYGTGRFGHPEQDRAITLREGAILQSFPMSYRFIPEDGKLFVKRTAKHIGNAVPPRLGEVVGESILTHVMEWQKDGKNH